MTSSQKKRNKISHTTTTPDTVTQNKTENTSLNKNTGKSKQKDKDGNNSNVHERNPRAMEKSWSLLAAFNIFCGVVAVVGAGCVHAWYMYQLHENQLWFTNIQEVEREISFRTESGLYYSYFKQLIQSSSLVQGISDLTKDTVTEHPDTINVLARMNVYQEVILASIYKLLGISVRPILFYTYSIFCLHGFLVSALCLLTWLLSDSWLAGVLTAAFYMFNRQDTTRVDSSVPLREHFALPFLWIQAVAITVYFKPRISRFLQGLSQVIILLSTLLFCLFWQFNQFIMMLQAFSLFGVWVLGLMPAHKVKYVLLCQLSSLLAVCAMQFGNYMIISSFAVSFIVSSVCLIAFLGELDRPRSTLMNIIVVISASALPLTMMVLLSTIIKLQLKVDSDEHIFRFLENKFGVGNVRDFDARMYLCLEIFGFIKRDIFERLAQNFVLPFYGLAHAVLLVYLGNTVIRKWIRLNKAKQEHKAHESYSTECLLHRPELAFHIVQAVFFAGLAIMTLRMKYLWTPYMCVLAAVGVADKSLWTQVLTFFRVNNRFSVDIARFSTVLIILSVMLKMLLPPVLDELKHETEFWDPDTVELMKWIQRNTPITASFTGSMQLLAGVKLCTGRHITNHPHYEDQYLRHKTKQLYQIYGRRTVEDVHKILTKYQTEFIILEDSICLAPSRDGCRIPDIVDIDNGVMPDVPVDIPGLTRPLILRFCDRVRDLSDRDLMLFKEVFKNKTFRVYQVLST
ncbi:hypothetical protein BsWGS_12536 [Bradybaena similaris]